MVDEKALAEARAAQQKAEAEAKAAQEKAAAAEAALAALKTEGSLEDRVKAVGTLVSSAGEAATTVKTEEHALAVMLAAQHGRLAGSAPAVAPVV